MKKTLTNLEREEVAIRDAWESGREATLDLREHLNNIRTHALYEAAGCRNFEMYCKKQRLPFGRTTAHQLAANGEVAGYLEKSSASDFSDRALAQLSKLRVITKNRKTGKPQKGGIDAAKVRRVAKKAIALSDNGKITATHVKQAIEKIAPPPAPTLGERLEREVRRCNKMLMSFDGLTDEAFLDADGECPGVAERLAKAYSALASYLRKVQ